MRACLVSILAAVILCTCGTVLAGDYEFSALTDAGTSMGEARVGVGLSETWSAGIIARYLDAAERPSKDWAFGAYGKMIVSPDASVPVADWLPKFGTWINLPESVPVETYVIGKLLALPYDGGVDFAAETGVGGRVGVLGIEYVYSVVESGGADNPVMYSGPTLWLSLTLPF